MFFIIQEAPSFVYMKDIFLCTKKGGFFMPKVRKEIPELEKLVQVGRKKFVRYEEGHNNIL